MVGPPMSMFSIISSRCAPGSRRHLLERVEVHHHHVDGLDAVVGERAHVLGVAAHGEDAAGDVGVHGLHAAVEHFGKAGDLGDVRDGDAARAQQRGGAAGGDEFHAHGAQLAREIDDAGLVRHAQQCPLDFGHISTISHFASTAPETGSW